MVAVGGGGTGDSDIGSVGNGGGRDGKVMTHH